MRVLWLAALLVAPGLALAAEAASPYTWTWSAGASFAGPLALALTVEQGADNACTLTSYASGEYGPDDFAMREETRRTRLGGHRTSLWTVQSPATGHATTDYWQGPRWTGGGYAFQLEAPRDTYTAVATNLKKWNADAAAPFTVTVACAQPFAVTGFAGSRQVVAWRHDNAPGATAVSYHPNSPVPFEPEANAATGGRVERTFTQGPVKLVFENSAIAGAGAGALVVQRPGATVVKPLADHEVYRTEGPAGAWAVTMHRVGAGYGVSATGYAYAMPPRASLDEIVAG